MKFVWKFFFSIDKQSEALPPGHLDLSLLNNCDRIVRVMDLSRNEEVKPAATNQKKSSGRKSATSDQVNSFVLSQILCMIPLLLVSFVT